MTIEQAVKILKADETDDSFDWDELGLKGTEDFNRAYDEAYEMAIKALEEGEGRQDLHERLDYPSVTQQPKIYPSVTQQQKIGYWKWQLADNGWADHICSECGFKHNTDIHVTLNWQYCPNCGAKMENDKQVDASDIGRK